MPAPPFWNQGLLFVSRRAVWKPQMPVWKLQVPPVPQSVVAKHCFPGVGLLLLHTPPPLYSHSGFGLMLPRLLKLERNGNQPPSLLSKFQGTLSPALGPVADARMPRSSRPFGMVSSPGSRVLLSFRSSPSVLFTLPVPPVVLSTKNRLEKVMSSSGKNSPLNGSILSAASIWRLRLKSRTSRPPCGQSVE